MCGMCGTQRLGGRGDRVITCKPKSRCRRTALCNKMQHQAQGTKSAPACIQPPQTSSCVPSIDQTRQNVNVTGLLYCDTALLGKNNPEGGQTGRNVLHPCKPPATHTRAGNLKSGMTQDIFVHWYAPPKPPSLSIRVVKLRNSCP